MCGLRRRTLAAVSRFVSGSRAVPDALLETVAFAEAVRRLCGEWGIDAVIPVAEPSLLALLPRRADLLPVRIPFRGSEPFLGVTDKVRVLRAAAEVGIAVLRQRVLGAAGDAPPWTTPSNSRRP